LLTDILKDLCEKCTVAVRLMNILLIFVSILRYVIIYEKGYQEFEKPYSSVTTKVKGLSLTNLTNSSNPLALYGGVHVWDSSDFVIPPEV